MKVQFKLKRTLLTVAASVALATSFICLGQKAMATATLPDIDPEIIANSWQEQDDTFASVTLNGKEILKFKESANCPNAGQKAEEIAAKLNELLLDDKFDAERLFPSRAGDLAALKVDGETVLKLSATDIVDSDQSEPSSALTMSWRMVNTIRNALGATQLPQSFLKFSELALHDIRGLGQAAGHFSGAASWYGGYFNGRKTADGTIYDERNMTAAHRSLPLGTKLLVMNRRTGDSCVVKVNDRGPYIDGRIIDLSKAAARQLNMVGCGVATVDCLVLGKD